MRERAEQSNAASPKFCSKIKINWWCVSVSRCKFFSDMCDRGHLHQRRLTASAEKRNGNMTAQHIETMGDSVLKAILKPVIWTIFLYCCILDWNLRL